MTLFRDGTCDDPACRLCNPELRETSVGQVCPPPTLPVPEFSDPFSVKAAKPRLDLFPPEAIFGTLPAIEYGAAKYAPRAWEGGLAYSTIYAAALRHLFAWWGGENVDAESGLPHLAHAAANLAFLLTFEARGVGKDDRP